MGNVLVGFAIVGSVIALGLLLGRAGAIDEATARALSRISVTVATPALLLVQLAHTDVHDVFSSAFVVVAVSTTATACLSLIVGRWQRADTLVFAFAASYVNSGNLGIPLASYAFGNAALVAPVIMFQLMFLQPLAVAALERTRHRHSSGLLPWLRVAASPVLIACLTGIAISAAGIELPEWIYQPFRLVGDLAIPGVLLAFGASLVHAKTQLDPANRRATLSAVAIKSLVHPAITFCTGRALGLGTTESMVVTALAALPSAQVVYAYASYHRRSVDFARDTVTISTLASVPVVMAVVALLA